MEIDALVQEKIKENDWSFVWAKYLTKSSIFSTETQQQHAQYTILQVLSAIQNGDSCLPTTIQQAEGLRSLVAFSEKNHLAPFIFDGDALYLYRYYALEKRLAKQIVRLMHHLPAKIESASYLNLLEDPYQQKALAMVGCQSLNIITGGPGTGKTYTLARIIAALHDANPELKIAMAAPTGKAAQRMQEALQTAFADPNLETLVTPALKMITPMTLHRLLGIGHQGVARFNLKQPLPYDVVVIDEASMLDLNLATLLFEALPAQARLILLGDAQQLASVDVGSVLADLQRIENLQNNQVNLKTSRRFSSEAQIRKMAQFIQSQPQGNILQQFENEVVKASQISLIELQTIETDVIQFEYLPNYLTNHQIEHYLNTLWLGFSNYQTALINYLAYPQDEYLKAVLTAFDQYRILTAMRYGYFGVVPLNQHMERQLLRGLERYTKKVGEWYIGRPVMMTENDYQLGLSNGDIGICFWHRTIPQQYEVYFPSLDKWVVATRLPRHIQTAFALTIHKSQGSEFTHTAVVLEDKATSLLSQELIYTAITRAKKAVTLLAHSTALESALLKKTARKSGLVRKIKNIFNNYN